MKIMTDATKTPPQDRLGLRLLKYENLLCLAYTRKCRDGSYKTRFVGIPFFRKDEPKKAA